MCEARLTDSGRRILASGHTIFYSGRTDNLHRGGVAVIVTRKVENTLLEWKPVNDRLMKVRFNSKFAAKLTIIALISLGTIHRCIDVSRYISRDSYRGNTKSHATCQQKKQKKKKMTNSINN